MSAPAPSSSTGASRSAARKADQVASSRSSRLRLAADLRAMAQDPPDGCSAAPVSEDNMYVWWATVIGPENSEWENAVLTLRLTFPEQYPDKPPRVRFTCEMFHPNVYSDGNVCLSLLNENWSAAYSVSSILTAVRSLLTDPNPNSPANPEAAQLFSTNYTQYKKRVRRIAQKSLE
ncbi:hypothetical protein CDCA_CDCA13G3616 [Cyanidium caldarium]|uniref:UBC core domain-containing protein n=1 Tax=Cyanidium caldarium TaxID=2771 RepID=A0AAV9IZN7_CYACA|nr:hypothetical protein CDCA_CDCA13G3616 [Cyanidium caldarium]